MVMGRQTENLHLCVNVVVAVVLYKHVKASLQWKAHAQNVMGWDAKFLRNAVNVMAVVCKINSVRWR